VVAGPRMRLRTHPAFLVGAVLVAACTREGVIHSAPTPNPSPPAIRISAEAVSACNKAQARAAPSFYAVCPSWLPSASVSSVPGNPPAPLRVTVINDPQRRVEGLEFSYSAPDDRHPKRNHPDRFLHFALLSAESALAQPLGEWDDLGTTEVGGKKGHLYYVAVPSYHKDHFVFRWTEENASLVASLHSWDREETLELLDQLVSNLDSPADIKRPRSVDERVSSTKLGSYGAIDVLVAPDYVWALGYTQGKMFPLDSVTGDVVGPPIKVGRYPTDVALDGSTMLVTRHDDTGTKPNESGVVRVSASGVVTGTVELGNAPRALAVVGGRAWILDADGRLHVVDATTLNNVFDPISLGGALVGVSEYDGRVIVLDAGHSRLLWMDPVTAAVTRELPLDGSLGGMTIVDRSIWVTDHGNRRLLRIDAVSGAIASSIPLPGMPGRVAASGSSVWVTDYWGGQLVRVDAATNRVQEQINVGGHPLEVTAEPRAVWVINDGKVQRVDVQG
jgi:YVTN family beta-propeller protein